MTFKTFAKEIFTPTVRERTDVKVGCHIGIDQRNVFLKRVGIRQLSGRTDRQNEVWAGKPVNMAAKLCGIAKDDELLVSDRYYKNIAGDDKTTKSCGCKEGILVDEKVALWETVDLSSKPQFDFDRGYMMETTWCVTHGSSFCEAIIRLDKQ